MPRTSKRKTPSSPAADAEASPPAPPPSPVARQPRKRRQLSSYNEFVRDNYSLPQVQSAPVRERLKILGRMWQEHKKSTA